MLFQHYNVNLQQKQVKLNRGHVVQGRDLNQDIIKKSQQTMCPGPPQSLITLTKEEHISILILSSSFESSSRSVLE